MKCRTGTVSSVGYAELQKKLCSRSYLLCVFIFFRQVNIKTDKSRDKKEPKEACCFSSKDSSSFE
ncbi:MAG: hypothetical protein D3925_00165 [Candidatus Electrothrix sp. AR5]|nr:hypothetical protein [Candidatus Electrothrix sp. AR5]